MYNNSFLSLLEYLSNAFGPSGCESEVRDFIVDCIKDHVDTLIKDPMGNLIATKGKADEVVIFAHMDEVGFMITGYRGDGSLTFSPIGGMTPENLASKRVVIGKNKIIGAIGIKPVHLKKQGDGKTEWNDLYLQIGAKNEEEAKQLVSIGDVAVFNTKFAAISENAFTGKALDNRIGCAILCHFIREGQLQNGTFVFSVQEETGLRGATAFLNKTPFSYGIALDTTTANDLPGIKLPHNVCYAGKGGVISFADGATIYRKALIQELFETLKEKGIPCQTKSRRTGGNEASALEKIGMGAEAISLSTPCRYIHGPIGKVLFTDITATADALLAIISHMKTRG